MSKHSHLTDRGRSFWNTARLWELAQGLPVQTVPLDRLAEFDQDCWFGPDAAPTCRAVAAHAKRIQEADLSHPVILAADGRLMDGGHRVSKAWLLGLSEIAAVRFETDPEPDWIEPLPVAAPASQPRIRPIALCLFQRDGRILVGNGFDVVKNSLYCRPLGGGIEFGERGQEAIVREMREELGAEITNVEWLGTLENLFTCDGRPGHQIVLLYDATFVDSSLYDRPVLHGHEEGAPQEAFTAEWKTLEELEAGPARLVPEGLMDFLRARESSECSA